MLDESASRTPPSLRKHALKLANVSPRAKSIGVKLSRRRPNCNQVACGIMIARLGSIGPPLPVREMIAVGVERMVDELT
jgi:hypothetical protein